MQTSEVYLLLSHPLDLRFYLFFSFYLCIKYIFCENIDKKLFMMISLGPVFLFIPAEFHCFLLSYSTRICLEIFVSFCFMRDQWFGNICHTLLCTSEKYSFVLFNPADFLCVLLRHPTRNCLEISYTICFVRGQLLGNICRNFLCPS